MGQKIGRLPDTWGELMEEKNRVMHWSSEILAKVDDNIKNEDTFLMEYDNVRIDEKVDRWIASHREKCDFALSGCPQEYSRNNLNIEVTRIADDLRHKMRKEYQGAYALMKKLTKRIDALGIDERKIHTEIQNLETVCENDPRIFISKFGPLRKRVIENLRQAEKMELKEKKLMTSFTRKVYDIDQKYIEECARRIDRLVKDFEKSVEHTRL